MQPARIIDLFRDLKSNLQEKMKNRTGQQELRDDQLKRCG
jgi:hypothetical protein